jgi:hypothetical protein
MKCVWLLIIVMTSVWLMPADGLAQEPIKATTFDGKHVLLYRDGSWKPATTDPGSVAHLGAFAEPQQVTLYSRRMYDDYMKATFSFKYGIRDDPGYKLTRNQWDLLFDNGDGGFSVGIGARGPESDRRPWRDDVERTQKGAGRCRFARRRSGRFGGSRAKPYVCGPHAQQHDRLVFGVQG